MRSLLLRTIAVAGAIVLLLMALVSSPPARSFVRGRAEAWLRDRAGIEAHIGSLDYGVTGLTVDVRDVSLAPRDNPNAPFLTVRRITAVLDGVPPFKAFRLISADIEGARVTLVRDAKGHLNVPRGSGEGGRPPAAWVVPDAIRFRDLAFSYRDASGFSIDAPGASWVAGRTSRGLEGGFAVDGFATIRWPERGVSFPSPRAHVVWDGDTVSIEHLTAMVLAGTPGQPRAPTQSARLGAATDASLATVKGRVSVRNVFGDTTIDADATGTASLELGARWLALPIDAAGSVEWKARAAGPISAPVIDLSARGSDVTVDRAKQLAVAADLRIADGMLILKEAAAETRGGRVRATGTFPLTARDRDAEFEASWQSLALSSVLAAVDIAGVPGIDARIDGHGRARWRNGDLRTLDATLTNHMTAAGAKVPLSGRAALNVRNARWTLTHDHLLGALAATGTVGGAIGSAGFDRVGMSGSLTARTDAAGDFLEQLADLGLVPSTMAEQVSAGQVQVDGTLAGTISNPRLEGTLTGSSVRIADRIPAQITARFALDTRRLVLSQLDLRQHQNRASFRGTIGWQNGSIEGEAEATITRFAEAWAAAGLPTEWLPAGRVEGHAQLRGRLARPIVDARVTGALGVRALEPAPLDATLRLDGDRLTIDSLAIETPAGRLAGTAEIDVASPAHAFTADVEVALEAVERLAPAFAPARWPLEGTWVMRATAEGRLDDPLSTKIDGTLERVDGAIAGLPVHLEQPAHVERVADRLTVYNLLVRSSDSTLLLDGSVGQESAITVALDLQLRDLAPLFHDVARESRPVLEGVVHVDARASGSIRRPLLQGSIVGRDLSAFLGTVPLATGVTMTAQIEDDTLTLSQLDGTWQDAKISATGALPLGLFQPLLPTAWKEALPAPAGPAHLDANVVGITPAALAPFLSPERLVNLGGRVSARLSIDADRLEAGAIRGEVVLDEAELVLAQIPIRQREPTRLRIGAGRVSIETLEWQGPRGTITAVGGLNIAGKEVRLDTAIDANVDLRMASAFMRNIATAGRAEISVSLSGPVRNPLVEGRVQLNDAELRLRDPRVAVSEVHGTLWLIGDRFQLDGLTGSVNGGSLTMGGSGQVRGLALESANITLAANDAAIEFPDGLRTEIAADLRLRKQAGDRSALVSGTLTALRGRFTQRLSIVGALFSGRKKSGTAAPASPLGALGDLRLDIGLATLEDVLVRIDYGRMEAGANLKLGGTLGNPTLSGRVALREGGTVFLGGTTYRLESGAIDFRGATPIVPELNIVARTEVAGYSIRMGVDGTTDRLRAELSSVPGLDQSDIVSLLVTGRTTSEGGLNTQVVGAQVLGYLSGDLLNVAGRVVGLDSVRIDRGIALDDLRFDPTIIAGDTDPGSRLTITKNLTRTVEAVLSQDLAKNGELSWVLTWRPLPVVSLRIVALDNENRTYEFRHELTFGGNAAPRPSTRAPKGPRVSTVVFNGARDHEAALQRVIKVKAGGRFNFYDWQDDRDRILSYFHERQYFEASVSARRREAKDEEGRTRVDLTYEIRPGRQDRLLIEGATLSEATDKKMREEWTRSVFDGFLVDDLTRIARLALAHDGYLRAQVTTTVERGTTGDNRVKTVRVQIAPGQRTEARTFAWSGNTAIDATRLDALVSKAGLGDEVWLNPSALEQPVRDAYVADGFMSARVVAGVPLFTEGSARLPVVIVEGPASTLGTVTYEGEKIVPEADLAAAAQLSPGTAFRPGQLEAASKRLERLYFDRGFNTARVDVNATAHDNGVVDVAVAIESGPQEVLASVDVAGAPNTHPGLITSALKLDIGKPLDAEKLFDARRRLYETGAFRQVDLHTEPVGETRTNDAGVVQQPVAARVELQEWPRWRFRYGFQVNDVYDDDTQTRDVGPGVMADLERSNLFGRAATAGVAAHVDTQVQALRSYVTTPRFFRWPLASTGFVQVERDTTGPYTMRTTNITLEQRYRLRRVFQVNYGYFFERVAADLTLEIPGFDPMPFEIVARYAGLFSAISLDRRDDPFNPQRGWFHSSGVRVATEWLGSDLRFVRYLAQQSFLRPIGGGIAIGWNGRLGLGDGIGQDIVLSEERFFAGGGTTVRGYRENSLGPQDRQGDPLGGEAMVISNQEVRFPIWKFVRGGVFLDVGNVFLQPSSIEFGELEVGAGFGLRFLTPIGILRFDLGVPVTGGGFAKSRLHFAFGQMF